MPNRCSLGGGKCDDKQVCLQKIKKYSFFNPHLRTFSFLAFRERRREREREKHRCERETSTGCHLVHAPTRPAIEPATWVRALTWWATPVRAKNTFKTTLSHWIPIGTIEVDILFIMLPVSELTVLERGRDGMTLKLRLSCSRGYCDAQLIQLHTFLAYLTCGRPYGPQVVKRTESGTRLNSSSITY